MVVTHNNVVHLVKKKKLKNNEKTEVIALVFKSTWNTRCINNIKYYISCIGRLNITFYFFIKLTKNKVNFHKFSNTLNIFMYFFLNSKICFGFSLPFLDTTKYTLSNGNYRGGLAYLFSPVHLIQIDSN